MQQQRSNRKMAVQASHILYPLEETTEAKRFAHDWRWYDRAKNADERPGISFMIRAKNEEKNIERCIESVRSRISSHIECEFLVCDNGSNDRTCEIAQQLFAARNDGKVLHYPFQLGKAGAEMHLTPLNSVHSIVWSCQYLMLQTTPFSHLAIWDADFEMTDRLAKRLLEDFASKNGPESAYTIPAIDHDGVVNQETFIFAATNLPRFHKYWMWKLIMYSTVSSVPAVTLPKSEYIVHNSTLRKVKTFQQYKPWWRQLSSAAEKESWHAQLDGMFNRMCERLAPNVQLFCRYCDPACQRICAQFPRLIEHFVSPLQTESRSNAHLEAKASQNNLYDFLLIHLLEKCSFDSILMVTNWSPHLSGQKSAKLCIFAEALFSANRPAFPMVCGDYIDGYLHADHNDFAEWLGENAGIRKFDLIVLGNAVDAAKPQFTKATLMQLITDAMYSALLPSGVIFVPKLASTTFDEVGAKTHPFWDISEDECEGWISVRWKPQIKHDFSILVSTHAHKLPSAWSIALLLCSLHNLASAINESFGSKHVLSCRIPLLLHFDHHKTTVCDRYLRILTRVLLGTTVKNQTVQFYSVFWKEKIETITKTFHVDIITSRRQDDLGLANTFVRLLDNCHTPFYLLWEHDWQFAKPIDLRYLLQCVQSNKDVNHLRLNKRRNLNSGWDERFSTDAKSIPSAGKKDISLPILRTDCWSNNPHFGRIAHWHSFCRHICFAESREPKKHALEDLLSKSLKASAAQEESKTGEWDRTHTEWGCFVYGRTSDTAAVKHIDGRTFQIGQKPLILVLGDNLLPAFVARRAGFTEINDSFCTKPISELSTLLPKFFASCPTRPVWIVFYCRETNSAMDVDASTNFMQNLCLQNLKNVYLQLWTAKSDKKSTKNDFCDIEQRGRNFHSIFFQTQREWCNVENWAAQQCAIEVFDDAFDIFSFASSCHAMSTRFG